jgi:hypothetical protein
MTATADHKVSFSPESLRFVLNADKNNKGGVFTAQSRVTGKDFTFKVSRTEWKERFYTHVKVEVEYLKFVYLGCYMDGKIMKKRQVVDTPAAKAIQWILNKVQKEEFQTLTDNVHLMHLGKCIRCGKTLTDQESITYGLGKVCRSLS